MMVKVGGHADPPALNGSAYRAIAEFNTNQLSGKYFR